MEIPSSLMVSVSGVRGRVGDGLTPEIVAAFAAAFGAWVRDGDPGADTPPKAGSSAAPSVVVGRDSRVSGPMFHRVVISALESVGLRVIDVGLSTTPTIQLAVESHHAGGGLAITASHNPVEWNALKFIAPSGLFLDAEQGAAMRRYLERPFRRAGWQDLGQISEDRSAVRRHIDAIFALDILDTTAIRARRFRVALDCCRGAGAIIMLPLLEELGCHVSAIETQPDGRFPRSPEPIPENLAELERLVAASHSEVGFAVDPDVDRLALVSEQGRALGEDYTLALAAKVVLGRRRGGVVTNLSTSRILDDVAAGFGCSVTRAPVGEVNVAVKMRDSGAVIGGEGNGGVILPDLHLGRDAPVAAALMLQLLAGDPRPISAIVSDYPRYVIVKEKLERPPGELRGVYDVIRGALPGGGEADTQDGLRLSWADSWVHVRPSGTEPIVRVIAEARDERQARELVAKCRRPLEELSRQRQ